MKKFLRIIGLFIVFILVSVAAVLAYIKFALPDVGDASEISFEYNAERVKRGKYLATTVCVCMDCHSKRDWTKFSGPLVEGTLGQGGETFDQRFGFPGTYISKNITPEGISRYTDGELFRVITTGVNKEGKPMFPVMPFLYYGKMDAEDIYSIIAYLRSIPPVKNNVAPSSHNFPMNFIINTIPRKGVPQPRPDKSDQIAYGAYLVNAGACIECHTQVDKGMIIPELAFGGGREFPIRDGSTVRSTNITPDNETGIGQWTEELFVRRFKLYADSTFVNETINPGDFNTWMPWTMYGQMEPTDLAAMFAYLKTIKPIKNSVNKFTAKK